MAYIDILTGTTHSIGGIKDFKIATRKTDGTPITFPLDVTFVTGSTDTILITEDFNARTITLGGDEIEFRYVYPKSCKYTEEEVKERQGDFFRKTLEWSMPKTNPTTQNQLKEFLFADEGEFAISNALVFFTDGNNQNWFASVDLPFILQTYDTTTGKRGEDNQYVLSYVCNSYMRTLKYIAH